MSARTAFIREEKVNTISRRLGKRNRETDRRLAEEVHTLTGRDAALRRPRGADLQGESNKPRRPGRRRSDGAARRPYHSLPRSQTPVWEGIWLSKLCFGVARKTVSGTTNVAAVANDKEDCVSR